MYSDAFDLSNRSRVTNDIPRTASTPVDKDQPNPLKTHHLRNNTNEDEHGEVLCSD